MRKVRISKKRKVHKHLPYSKKKILLFTAVGVGIIAAIWTFFLAPFYQQTTASNKPIRPVINHRFKAVCGETNNRSARCTARVVTDDLGSPHASTSPPSTALTPGDLHIAYNLPCTPGGSVQKQCATPSTFGPIVAVVDAYHTPTIENDLNVFSSNFGLPSCTRANGCLQIVDENGGTNLPTTVDQSWSLETAMDVQTVHALCQTCKILLVEANAATYFDLATGVNTAAKMGAVAISNSYGAPEFYGETSYDALYNHPGIAVIASSGDSGYGVQYPAASTNVIGVGGTTLNVFMDSTYAGETVWSGSGSGCSVYENALSSQTGFANWSATGCSVHKGIADISADADPNTGVAVYDTTPYANQTGWWQVGGTSLSAPIVAAAFALANNKNIPSGTQIASLLYSNYNNGNFHDVTLGKNGNCSTIMCIGAPGYDGPTGLGTLNGLGGFGGPAQPTLTPTIPSSPMPIPPQAWITTNKYIYRFKFDGTNAWPPITSQAYYSPIGIALVGGEVWTSNIQFTGSISRFDMNGELLTSPQITGNGLNSPQDMAIVGKQVWVLNENGTNPANSISRFNFDGSSAGIPITGNGLCIPDAIAVVGTQVWVGNRLCGTQKTGTISRFNFDGTAAGTIITVNGTSIIGGIAVVGNQVWILNFLNNSISLYNFNGTPVLSTVKVKGKYIPLIISGNGLNHPGFIGVVGNQVWVGNQGSSTISRFNFDGTAAGTPINLVKSTIPYNITVVPQH